MGTGIGEMLQAQSAREQMARTMNAHNERTTNARIKKLKTQYETKIAQLRENYRIQTNNVAIVEAGTGNSVAQTQTAIDIIMQLSGKSFEQTKDMIYQNTTEARYDRMQAWVKSSPKYEGGLINDARVELLREKQ
jgi:hypothetical protein